MDLNFKIASCTTRIMRKNILTGIAIGFVLEILTLVEEARQDNMELKF